MSINDPHGPVVSLRHPIPTAKVPANGINEPGIRASMPIIELPDIVQSLQNRRWTGTLEILAKENKQGYLFFRDGAIHYCKNEHSNKQLADALFELQHIDEADHDLLVHHQGDGTQLLLDLGIVTEDAIRQARTHVGMEDVLDTFQWDGLDTKFHPGDEPLDVFEPADRNTPLGLTGMSVLMEAARRADELERMGHHIPSEHDVIVPTNPEGLPDGLLDRRMILLIDGYRSAYEIARKAPFDTIETLQALSDLIEQGHLQCIEPTGLAKIGVIAEQDEDFKKALAVYELAASRGLEHLDLFRRTARALQVLGRSQEALERWLDVADRRLKVDRQDLAVSALREAVELNPHDSALGLRLVDVLTQTDHRDEALERLRGLIALAEGADDLQRSLELADKYLELDDQAVDMLEKAAQLHLADKDPIPAMSRFDDMATVLIEQQKFDEAVKTFYRILDIDTENLEARLRLSQTLADMGATDEAVREYQALADILYRSGLISNSINWSFLIRVYESIVELEPNSTPAWEWLAKAYIEDGQHDMAISRYLGMAESLQPPAGETPPPELLQPLRRVVELAPDRLDVRERLAQTHLALNQVDRAVRTYRDLAEFALQQSQPDVASDAYDKALGIAPFDVDSRRGLANIDAARNDTDAAHLAWKRIGGMCLRAGLFEDACRDLERALSLQRDDADVLHELALAYEGRGDTTQAAALLTQYAELMAQRENKGLARQAAEHALRLQPGHPPAQAVLDTA